MPRSTRDGAPPASTHASQSPGAGHSPQLARHSLSVQRDRASVPDKPFPPTFLESLTSDAHAHTRPTLADVAERSRVPHAPRQHDGGPQVLEPAAE
jgi:hypothetical protein